MENEYMYEYISVYQNTSEQLDIHVGNGQMSQGQILIVSTLLNVKV